jgi:hypothetical protein
VVAYTEVPPEGALVPEAVAKFAPGQEGIINLVESPQGYWRCTVEFPPLPVVREEAEEKVEQPLSPAQEGAGEGEGLEPGRQMDVFLLANYGRYGLLCDDTGARTIMWRLAATRAWPPASPHTPADEASDLIDVAPEHLPYYGPRAGERRKSSRARSSGGGGGGSRHGSRATVDLAAGDTVATFVDVDDGETKLAPGEGRKSSTRSDGRKSSAKPEGRKSSVSPERRKSSLSSSRK